MERSLYAVNVNLARLFFATALIAWGLQHLMFGYFIAGRPVAWPAGLPGENIIAYISGVVLIAGGLSVFIKQKAVLMLTIVSVMILVWCGLRNIYFVVTALDYGGALTNMGKALTIGSGAMLAARTLHSGNNKLMIVATWCQYLTGLFLLASGIQHFLFADFVKFLMPAWIPGALFWTYFSGVALAAAGIALITGIQAKLAAALAGWMIFIWVFVLHIPRAIAEPSQNEWTAVFEALAVSGVLFMLAATIKKK